MIELKAETIGEAWIEACRTIFNKGEAMKDENKGIRELLHFVVTIKNPSENDKLVEKYGDKKMIEWMNSNFLEQKRVPELKNALSYGFRLFNFNGKNQVEWVIEKLRKKPETKAATISMIMKEDESYIPCVSMLDFKLRNNRLTLTAFCRSIDFGNKVYANMIALHKIQKMVAEKLNAECGEIIMNVVSAHIYDEDYEKIKEILK